MLVDLVKHLLRTTAFHELAKISVFSITLQPVQFGVFTDPSTIVHSLHRLNFCIFTLFKPLASFLYAIDLVQPFLRAEVTLELAEISIH